LVQSHLLAEVLAEVLLHLVITNQAILVDLAEELIDNHHQTKEMEMTHQLVHLKEILEEDNLTHVILAEVPAEVPAEAAVMVLNQMVEVVLLLQRQDLVLVFVKEEDQLLLLVETAVLQIEDKAVEVAEETKDLILEVAQVL
jgi:alanine dehydrogenase